MFQKWEVAHEDIETILTHLKQIPTLDQSNNNITIVEIGRLAGKFTHALRKTWQTSTIFTLDNDQQMTKIDPIAYARSMLDLAEINATVIRTNSPPLFAWPRAWSFDLLVVDIGSDYDKIRNNLRWWSRSAKRYTDGTSGIMLINMPLASNTKNTARELFIAEEGISVEPITHNWAIIRYD